MKLKQLLVFPALSLIVLFTPGAASAGWESQVNKAAPGAGKTYNIAEKGAVADSKTMNTKAIQAVIDECAGNGGGTLLVPNGTFLTGALFLKKGVNIELQEGAVLKGSTDINDYPKINTRIEGEQQGC